MSKFIYVRNRNLPIIPKTKYDYGLYMKLRRDPEVISNTFGGLNRFVTNDGKSGMFINDDRYTFIGDLNYHIDRIPLSLKENAETVTDNFINDLIQDISIRVGEKISKFDRDLVNGTLRNTNNKYDAIKKEIVLAIVEVSREYKKRGHDFKNDPNFANSYIFNTKTYKFINNISNALKVYFDAERERYDIDVKPFAKSDQFQLKKRNYFRDLSKEKLINLFPKDDRYNWITKNKANLPEEKYGLTYGDYDMYESRVSKNKNIRKKSDIILQNLYKGNAKFKRAVKSYSENRVLHDIIYIKDGVKDIEFADTGKTLKTKNGVTKFKTIGSNEKEYRYEDKQLYVDGKSLGKYKFLKFTNEDTGKFIVVFIKKVV